MPWLRRRCVLLSLLVLLTGLRLHGQVVRGPEVVLRLSQTVSSATAKAGQVILLEAVRPVEVDGKVRIATGAQARGVVSVARKRGHNRRDGRLVLTIETVRDVDGRDLPLGLTAMEQGGGNLPIFGPCTFPFPADPVGLFRHGSNVVIPSGTEIAAVLAVAP